MSNPYGPPPGQPYGNQPPPPQGGHPQPPYQAVHQGPPQGYPPNGYQPHPPQQPATTHNTAGILALIFGIIAFILSLFSAGWRIGFLGGIVATICGITGRTRAKHGIANNKHLATAGMILGILAVVGAIYTYAKYGA